MATAIAEQKITSFKQLRVWQNAIELVKDVYRLCESLPREELYGLASQMKRAAISIPSNISEGHSKKQRAEYRRFVYLAIGSAAELETQLHLTTELGFIAPQRLTPIMERLNYIKAMLLTLGDRLS